MTVPLTVVYLTRLRLPSFSPQAIQILATAHALAEAGATVHLFPDRPAPAGVPFPCLAPGGSPALAEPLNLSRPGHPRQPSRFRPDPASLLASHGLTLHPRLRIRWLRYPHPPVAGLEYRTQVGAALYHAVRKRTPVVLLSRRVDYAAAFLRTRARWDLPVHLVHEWHYLDSANALEAGRVEEARRYAKLEHTVATLADGHVAVSPRFPEFLRRRRNLPGPIQVVPNGGPAPVAFPFRTPGQGGPASQVRKRIRVTYAGLFRRTADLIPLLEAIPHLPPGVEVSVLGGDDGGDRLHEVIRAAEIRGLTPRFKVAPDVPDPGLPVCAPPTLCFTGPLSPVEARAHLTQAHVAVASFADTVNMRWFASPLKLFEYHAAGLPVVSTDHPTVRELVENGKSGILVPPGNGPGLAKAVAEVLDNPERAHRLVTEGLRLAASRTWRNRGEELLACLEQVCRLSKGSRPRWPGLRG